MPTLAIAIFVAVFAIATFRNIHLGVLMLPAAVAVGVWLAGMPIRDILAGFPINILVLVGGVTYFFGIAQANGTIDGVIQKLIAGSRRPARAAAISDLPDHGRCCVHGLVAGGIRHDPARDGSGEALGCGSDVDGRCAQLWHEHWRVRADQPVRHRHGHDGPSGRHRSQSAYAAGRSA